MRCETCGMSFRYMLYREVLEHCEGHRRKAKKLKAVQTFRTNELGMFEASNGRFTMIGM